MEFNVFLKKFQHIPVLTSKLVLTGEADPASLRVQMARWVKAGHLLLLRRGMYVFAELFKKRPDSSFYLASVITAPSYISLESALAYHGLIPEAVYTTTSVTTKRPGLFATPLGRFDYRHVHARYFWGYSVLSEQGGNAFMAHPEKALLDFVYLRSPRLTRAYLDEWRLQNFDRIDAARLLEYGRRFEKPGMQKTAQLLADYFAAQTKEERVL